MKQKLRRGLAGLSAAVMLTGAMQVPASAADLDYAKALQLSLYFYECQQAGHLPDWNRVEWRADSCTEDPVDGGWYDAGDHVKFNLPMSYSAAMLAWGLYEYGDGVEACGELTNYVNNLGFVLDYLAGCDKGSTVIYQCGIGKDDHSWWGPVELYDYGMKDQGKDSRGYLESGKGITAVTAGMSAALAAGYCALQGKTDASKLSGYLEHAENLFKLADGDRSDDVYNKSDAQGFYQSSHFYDELFYAANWLYIATKDDSYLDKAKSYIPNLGTELGQGDTLKYSWTHCWDDAQQGGTLLYAINTGDATWKAQVKKHLDYWKDTKDLVSGGLVYVSNWGCLRYATTVGFITAVACDELFKDDSSYDAYKKMYETQINFALGDNPSKQCYQVGYAENSPKNPHHRTAHGSWMNALKTPTTNRHILYGALVGGPNQDGSYEDDRQNYINNEVATDYNAGFTALLCKMVSEYGGQGDPAFPYPEEREPEFFVEAKATHESSGTTVSMKITNHTAWPARVVDNISMRYYLDLSEIKKAGLNPEDIVLRCDRDQSGMYSGDGVKPAAISPVTHYSGDIYYVEVHFPDGRAFLPISEGQHQCEILLAMIYPDYGSGWDATNDYSAEGLDSKDTKLTTKIPVYENGTLIFGEEPDGTVGKGSLSAAPAPDGSSIPISNPAKTTAPAETTAKQETTSSAPATTKTEAPINDTAPASSDTEAEDRANYGDANEDGKVTVSDAILMARVVAEDKTATITSNGRDNADVAKNGVLDTDDTVKLLKYLAGLVQKSDLGSAS